MSKTILVCGGRDYADYDRFHEIMHLHAADASVIIEGGHRPPIDPRTKRRRMRSADYLAFRWALANDITVITVPAKWDDGAWAGPARNKKMADMKPDAAIAFPGGKGTEDMVRRLKKAGIPVLEVPALALQTMEPDGPVVA
jgi:hypothetical protein